MACRDVHKKRDKDVQCDECEARPEEILEENSDIWHLLSLCSSQWRVGMGGAYGLDYGVVMEVAKAMWFDTDEIFFEKLRAYEAAVLDEMNKKEKDRHGAKRN